MLKKYGKYIIGFILIVVGVAVLGIIVYNLLTKQKDAETVINEMSKIYYEEHYFVEFKSKYEEDFEKKAKELEEKGITKSLFDISRTIDHPDKHRLYNSNDSGIDCDLKKTYVVYYPKCPYGQYDYDMKITMSCEK